MNNSKGSFDSLRHFVTRDEFLLLARITSMHSHQRQTRRRSESCEFLNQFNGKNPNQS